MAANPSAAPFGTSGERIVRREGVDVGGHIGGTPS
jgi:hypothetical protein